jgi:hypothetical protein
MVSIVAVMPKNFVSFRKGESVQFVMPYIQLSLLLEQTNDSITPDTFSYLIGNIKESADLAKNISTYLRDEVLILDETSIILNKAIGIPSQEYLSISKKIELLKVLFSVLLVFCFIAFIAFITGENNKKQQEFIVRRYCGATKKQLLIQRLLESFYNVITIIFFCCLVFPLVQSSIPLILPQLNETTVNWHIRQVVPIVLFWVALLICLMVLVLFIQDSCIKSHVGRGESSSLSLKLQSYFLLSSLLILTLIALYITILLFNSQRALFKTDIGFISDDRFIVSFSMPEDLYGKKIMANQSAKLLIRELEYNTQLDHVALTSAPPLSDHRSYGQWYTPTNQKIGVGTKSNTSVNLISPSYFSTLGININKGTTLSWRNAYEVVVNQRLWDLYFTGKSLAQAKLLSINSLNNEKVEYQIVGVVNNVLIQGPDSSPEPIVYQPILALMGLESIVVSTKVPLEQVKSVVERSVGMVDVKFQDIEIHSLMALIKTENEPRVALLIVAIISTLIVLLSSIVFCLVTIGQLSEKMAREFSVRFCFGAKISHLLRDECLLFLLTFIPTLCVFITLFVAFGPLLDKHLVQTPLFNPVLIVQLLIGLIVLLLPIFYYNVHQKTRDAWRYLS